MKDKSLSEAKSEAQRFLAAVYQLQRLKPVRKGNGESVYEEVMMLGGPETAAVKRASMDLTRALARLRHGGCD